MQKFNPLYLRSSRWSELRPLLGQPLGLERQRFERAIGLIPMSAEASKSKELRFLPCRSWSEQGDAGRNRLRGAWNHIQTFYIDDLWGPGALEFLLAIHAEVMGVEVSSFRAHEVALDGIPLLSPSEIPQALTWLLSKVKQDFREGEGAIYAAARLYQGLISIHPFADGNGRTSHLLMNWMLSSARYPLPHWSSMQEFQVALYAQRLNNCAYADVVNDLIAALQEAAAL